MAKTTGRKTGVRWWNMPAMNTLCFVLRPVMKENENGALELYYLMQSKYKSDRSG